MVSPNAVEEESLGDSLPISFLASNKEEDFISLENPRKSSLGLSSFPSDMETLPCYEFLETDRGDIIPLPFGEAETSVRTGLEGEELEADKSVEAEECDVTVSLFEFVFAESESTCPRDGIDCKVFAEGEATEIVRYEVCTEMLGWVES